MGGVVGRDVTHGSHAVPPCRLTARRSRQSRRRPRLGPLIPIEGPRRGGGRKATPYESEAQNLSGEGSTRADDGRQGAEEEPDHGEHPPGYWVEPDPTGVVLAVPDP